MPRLSETVSGSPDPSLCQVGHGSDTDPGLPEETQSQTQQEGNHMRLTRKSPTKRAPKTIMVQRMWIKVQESPTPISVHIQPHFSLRRGETFHVEVSADELIDAIGTEEAIDADFVQQFIKGGI